jgi:hypothetical protein
MFYTSLLFNFHVSLYAFLCWLVASLTIHVFVHYLKKSCSPSNFVAIDHNSVMCNTIIIKTLVLISDHYIPPKVIPLQQQQGVKIGVVPAS